MATHVPHLLHPVYPVHTYESLGIKRTPSMPPTPKGSRFPSQEDLSENHLHGILAEDNDIIVKAATRALEQAADKAQPKQKLTLRIARNAKEARNFIIERALKVGKKTDFLMTDNHMPNSQDSKNPSGSDAGVGLFDWIDTVPWLRPNTEHMYTADDHVTAESSTAKRPSIRGSLRRILPTLSDKKVKPAAQQTIDSAINNKKAKNRNIVPPSINPRRSHESTFSAFVKKAGEGLDALSLTSSRRRGLSDSQAGSPFASPSLAKVADMEVAGGFFEQPPSDRGSKTSVVTSSSKRPRAATTSKPEPPSKRPQAVKPDEN